MLPSFCKDTVMRIRPTTTQSRGSTILVYEETSSNTLLIGGCSMQPASTSLSEDGRVLGITDTYTLFAPPDADIEAGDRIKFKDKVYTIQGDVRIQPAAGRLDHIELTLRRYSG